MIRTHLPDTIIIQSNQSRYTAINRFCYSTACMSLAYVIALAVLQYYRHAFIMAIEMTVFLGAAALNKQKRFFLSRNIILAVTNFGIFYFSIQLGFRSGIHLYLYTSPLICYLLYHFEERKKITLAFALYLMNFFLVFAIHHYQWFAPLELSEDAQNIFYVLNFAFSLGLSFALIVYFAFNNHAFTKKLTETNRVLAEQQEQLQKAKSVQNDAQEAVRKAIGERDKLLQEVHHRVKNNLAVISGLVELQNFYTKDEKASAILQQSRNRIKSIAVLHEKLYENKSLEKVSVKGYVDDLLHFTRLTFANQHKDIQIHTRIDDLELGLTEALPFSLLLNELLTNSYKHGFRDRTKGNIFLAITLADSQNVIFEFSDDGNGFDYANFVKDQSLGMNLVETFCRQLKGAMQFSSEPAKGMRFKLTFKV